MYIDNDIILALVPVLCRSVIVFNSMYEGQCRGKSTWVDTARPQRYQLFVQRISA
jgi:hypothetical protein